MAGYPLVSARSFKKSVLLYVAIVLATLAVFFLCAEVFLRIRSQGITAYWPGDFDADVGSIKRSGAEGRFTNDIDYWSVQRVNGEGFLEREPALRPPCRDGDCTRIAVIGDSFVDAVQLDIGDKVQVRLESLLNGQRPGHRFQTRAYGICGTGQATQLKLYDKFARPFSPRYVILVFVQNDFRNNSCVLESLCAGYDPLHTPVPLALKRDAQASYELTPVDPDWEQHLLPRPPKVSGNPLLRLANSNSFFYRWLVPQLAQRAGWPTAFLAGEAHFPHDPVDAWYDLPLELFDTAYQRETLPPLFAEGIEATRFAFAEWKKRADDSRFTLIVLISHGVEGQYLARTTALLDALGIEYLVQADYIRSLGKHISDADFRYDRHWNADGHRWAAEMLADRIARDFPASTIPPAPAPAQRP